MNQRHLLTSMGLVVLLAIIVACAPAPTPVPPTPPPTTAPVVAPTSAPAATAVPAVTKAPEPTKAPVPTTAPTAASKYKEAPALTDQVKAGKLPPVDQRLPENPLVVPTDEIGKYGGIWHRGFLGPSDFNGVVRVMGDGLVRYSPDASKIEMKLAESVTPNSDFSQWTIKLRKGSKWSDGTPFTSDDIMFWYKDVVLNKDLTPALPVWMKNNDGSAVKVEKLDEVSVKFTYPQPMTTFAFELATKDNGDRQYPMFMPSTYVKKFHPSYANKADLDKMIADNKFKTWPELFSLMADPFTNPDRPVMAAWKSVNRISDQIFIFRRNPYFVGVDKEGNQLPYIDEVQFKFFSEALSLNLAAIAGELDQQERQIALTNFPVLKENETKLGKYKIFLWKSIGGVDGGLVFNQTTKDAELQKLFSDLNWRIAISYAVNRKQIQEASFLGTGEPRQAVIKKGHPWYPGDEFAYKYTEYKPDLSNQMLDQLGLNKKGTDGFRLLPSGKRAEFEISVASGFAQWPEMAQMVSKDLEKVGIKANVQLRERSLHFSMKESNSLQSEMAGEDTTATIFSGGSHVDPRTPAYNNLNYGPLWKTWFDTEGKQGAEPPAAMKQMVQLITQGKVAGPDDQAKIGQQIFKLWADQLYIIGFVGLTALDQGVAVVNVNLHNVPAELTKDWPLRTPGNARPEQFFFIK